MNVVWVYFHSIQIGFLYTFDVIELISKAMADVISHWGWVGCCWWGRGKVTFVLLKSLREHLHETSLPLSIDNLGVVITPHFGITFRKINILSDFISYFHLNELIKIIETPLKCLERWNWESQEGCGDTYPFVKHIDRF